jgi:hypothetical protein
MKRGTILRINEKNLALFIGFLVLTVITISNLVKWEKMLRFRIPNLLPEGGQVWCADYMSLLSPIRYFAVQEEEINFPLAFNILVFTDLNRAMRLLRTTYRPHNSYCIHVDAKAAENYTKSLKMFASCLGKNVFFVSDSERKDAIWGTIHNLEPEIACSRLHLQRSSSWKYLINLTGQEFPLKTNWEIVSALKALNGANVVGAIYKRRNKDRFPPRSYFNYNVR